MAEDIQKNDWPKDGSDPNSTEPSALVNSARQGFAGGQ